MVTNDSNLLDLQQVDYSSSISLREALTGANALYLNCTVTMYQDNNLYKRIIDAAIRVGVQHIVYSSIVGCDKEPQHGIPHWDGARHIEAYLAIRHDETRQAFRYHIIRYAPHCNEHLLTHYAPSDDGWIAYPWHPSIRVHTASARDGARVVCKLFCQPESLKNGAIMNMITDFRNPHEMAQYITLATEKPVQAYKGPASLVTMGHLMGYESKSIVAMGDYIEHNWTKDFGKPLKYCVKEFLEDEIQKEPLETVEAFVNRVFKPVATTKSSS